MKGKKVCKKCEKLVSVVDVYTVEGETIYLCLECSNSVKKLLKSCKKEESKYEL